MGKNRDHSKFPNAITVLDNGNVGIGTLSPQRLLHLNAASDTRLMISDNVVSATSGLYLRQFGSNSAIVNQSNGTMQFGTNDTYFMTATATGNVGIGTSSPNALLQVNGSSLIGSGTLTNGTTYGGGGQVNRLKVESGNYTCLEINGSTSGGSIQFTYGTNLPNQVGALIGYNYGSGTVNGFDIANMLNGPMILSTNATERMRITSGGSVLINGTNNLWGGTNRGVVHINGADAILGITINGTNSAYMYHSGSELFIKQTKTGCNMTIGNEAAADVLFISNNTERMRISSAGSISTNVSRFIQQGLSRLCYAGSVQGSQSITITLNVGSQSAVKITAAMNHYGYISGYGCARMSWVGSNPAFSEINISDVTSANGGSWSFGNGGTGIITITKNAGSYGGGGYFFVEVIGNDPISIA